MREKKLRKRLQKKTPETGEEKAPEAGEVKQECDNSQCDMDSGNCADSYDESGATSDSIIKKHIFFSMGVGLIPVPMLDMVAITGVQLNMLRKLAEMYEVPFNEHKVKSTLSSLVGGGG